jgi:hypothetical protein
MLPNSPVPQRGKGIGHASRRSLMDRYAVARIYRRTTLVLLVILAVWAVISYF